MEENMTVAPEVAEAQTAAPAKEGERPPLPVEYPYYIPPSFV